MHLHLIRRLRAVGLALLLTALAGAVSASGAAAEGPARLRLATTTSTADSGLLAAILPAFERRCGCRVDVIAVGSGQALEIGRRGDADVLLVHSRQAEERFVAEGHARVRRDVMHNDFVLVGPGHDPARVRGRRLAREAFAAIARAQAPFVSRGDKSGTDVAEKTVWAALGLPVARSGWYRSLGQGMGETLIAAQEQQAYTLADRGTWLAMRAKLAGLDLLVGGRTLAENLDPTLRNPYGVLVVSAERHPGVQADLARRFADWLLAPETQNAIGQFGVARYGQPLFYPDAAGAGAR